MEEGSDLARMVLESRGGAVPSSVLDQTRGVISLEVPLCIHTLIVHEHCLNAVNPCANAQLMEAWTITLKRNSQTQEKSLAMIFLRNAVRSHLHFSQLNSWIMNNGGELPGGTACAYRLSLSDPLSGEWDNEELCEEHSFPVARCDSNSQLFVSVKWRKRSSFPQLAPCTPFSDIRCESEEWLLPGSSICSSPSSHSFNSPGDSCTDTPHFFISPEDDHHRCNALKNTDSRDIAVGTADSRLHNAARKLLFDRDGDVARHDDVVRQGDVAKPDGDVDVDGISLDINAITNVTAKKECIHAAKGFSDEILEGCSKKLAKELEDGSLPVKRVLEQEKDLLESCKHAVAGTATGKSDARKKNVRVTGRFVVGATEVEKLADFLADTLTLSESAPAPVNDSETAPANASGPRRESLPRRSQLAAAFRASASAVPMAFSKTTGLPLNSSPAPFTRNGTSFENNFHRLPQRRVSENADSSSSDEKLYIARSAPTSSGLLGNFEESALNGRLEPLAKLDGFRLQISASGAASTASHMTLPLAAYVFNLPDEEAPSPYMGHCSLEELGRKGFNIPPKGTFQATLFNPQGTVVRVFVVRFDLTEMPPKSSTFLRQRTFFMPPACKIEEAHGSWLRYLIHLRVASDRRGRIYIHTDIRMLFSQKCDLEAINFELEKTEAEQYELCTFTEMPDGPRFSLRE